VIKALVLTVSDRVSRDAYEDKSGPAVEEVLKKGIEDIETFRLVVSDDPNNIKQVLNENLNADFIITTGGTGIGPRDNTPDITEKFCDRMIPGISDFLRRESCKQTLNAALSRGAAGIKGKTVIINLPGSERGARFCAELLVPVLPHAVRMLAGKGH
jgi:molybdopterin adenylyltransferase